MESQDAAFKLQERIDGTTAWLEQAAPNIHIEQSHLDEGSRERAYWHYGYLAASRDARNLLLDFNIAPELQ